MATGFRIHEDLTEKENQVQLAGKSVNVGAGLKQQIQQRSTFGVLNNLAGNGRAATALANIGGDKAVSFGGRVVVVAIPMSGRVLNGRNVLKVFFFLEFNLLRKC